MKKVILLICVLAFLGCETPNIEKKTTDVIIDETGRKVEIMMFDGCEYVYVEIYRKLGLAHKGNCKNPIHQCK